MDTSVAIRKNLERKRAAASNVGDNDSHARDCPDKEAANRTVQIEEDTPTSDADSSALMASYTMSNPAARIAQRSTLGIRLRRVHRGNVETRRINGFSDGLNVAALVRASVIKTLCI